MTPSCITVFIDYLLRIPVIHRDEDMRIQFEQTIYNPACTFVHDPTGPLKRAAQKGGSVADGMGYSADWKERSGKTVGAPRGHRCFDSPCLLLVEDDHEWNLAVRCNAFVRDIAPLRDG